MEISIYEPVDLIITLMKTTINGMTDRIRRLRQESFDTQPSLSIERALIETEFYKENEGKYPIPILRALNFLEICKRKTIYIGEDELIVGERGPRPKAVSTFPELTCHSVEDLHVLNTRELQRYTISQEDIDTYEREVIPYWKGRTQRERIFNHVPKEWKEAYEVGMFTEFMEQRAPGHTSLDGKVYQHGMLDLKERIAHELKNLDFMNDPEATDKQEELTAMSISCDAAIIFAERHADHDERDDEHAEHVEAAGHCGVLRDGGKARVNEGRTAVDGRQARTAERGGRRVAEQRDGDGGGGVKAEGHEERGGDGGGSARARRALKEDRQHHADDDDLHAAVVADLRNGGFHILDGAGLAQQVQNGERAEDHQHDLEAFLDAFPDQRVEHLDVFSKREAVEVKIGKGKDKRPGKGDGRDGFCGFFEAQDADKHDGNWAERHEEV